MKWYREKLAELAAARPIYAVCGDDCAVCPRYLAQTEDELLQTAEFWFRAGWRDRAVSGSEIKCSGCGSRPTYSYMLLPCAKEHGVRECAQCGQFICGRIKTMYADSEAKKNSCRETCESEEEFAMLCRAFYEKEKNMSRTHE